MFVICQTKTQKSRKTWPCNSGKRKGLDQREWVQDSLCTSKFKGWGVYVVCYILTAAYTCTITQQPSFPQPSRYKITTKCRGISKTTTCITLPISLPLVRAFFKVKEVIKLQVKR